MFQPAATPSTASPRSTQLPDVFDAGAAAKTEYLEIAAYESLITTAEALGETEIVSLLEENLADPGEHDDLGD